MPSTIEQSLAQIKRRIAAIEPTGRLVAVSKTKPLSAVRVAFAAGQRDFGENYVQEALGKITELGDVGASWHMLGPLQSNKCKDVSEHFDWLQSLDRAKLIVPLAQARSGAKAPLNVLIQVNIDDEESKSGCSPAQIDGLASTIAEHPTLKLRGLMAIPKPTPELSQRRDAFARMRALFEQLKQQYPVDTLSIGMSDDFELALREGATMVRVGSAIFGSR